MPAFILIGLVIVIGLGLFFMRPGTSTKYDSFAQCLTEKGAAMYGAYWCPHCQDQKQLFAGSWQYVTYVECDNGANQQTAACTEAGITGYPTWIFADGSRIEGEASLAQLSASTGCPL